MSFNLKSLFFKQKKRKIDSRNANQLNLMENSRIKILVVDDEPDILEFMQYNL